MVGAPQVELKVRSKQTTVTAPSTPPHQPPEGTVR